MNSTASSAASPFLRAVKLGEGVDLTDRRVVVIGGGNVAMDTARTARRLGASDVTVVYRRTREEMPAHHVEADDTEKEGVQLRLPGRPGRRSSTTASGAARALRCIADGAGRPDASGRRRPEPVPAASSTSSATWSSPRSGWRPTPPAFGGQVAHRPRAARSAVDERTLQTDVPWLFAAGDVVSRRRPTSPGRPARASAPRS